MVFAGVGTAAALYINSLNSALSFDNEEDAQALREALAPVENENDPFYVMLLGSDARGDEASRSDVNILLRVDPGKGQLTMVSIPRDTKVEIEGHGTQKINAAYAFGGAALAVKTMADFTGVPISTMQRFTSTSWCSLSMRWEESRSTSPPQQRSQCWRFP